MNLDALESFRVFAETLNFTHAAERRYLTQPALHKQVQNLASELGVSLYGKNGRELFLTPAGTDVARFARDIREQLANLQAQVSGGRDELPITLSAGRGSYLYLLGQAIRSFQTCTPGTLKTQIDNSEGTIAAVRSGEAHIGVTVLLEEPEGLLVTPIQEVAPHLIVSNEHALSCCDFVTIRDLDGLDLITPPSPSPLRDMIRTLLLREQRAFSPIMEVPGWELAMHFASLGLGATIVNGCCHPPPATKAIPLKGFPSTIYYLIERRSGLFHKQARALKECILREASAVQLFGS